MATGPGSYSRHKFLDEILTPLIRDNGTAMSSEEQRQRILDNLLIGMPGDAAGDVSAGEVTATSGGTDTLAGWMDSLVAPTTGLVDRVGALEDKRIVVLEDYGTGVGLGDVDADTAALELAAAEANIEINGRGKEYYFKNGVTITTPGVYFRNMRAKVKLGTGGFDSKETITGRYDTNHSLFCYEGADGGGLENVEIYGDGGGEYVCLPVTVNNGMDTRPFVCRGVVHIHGFTGITGTFLVNGVGAAGYFIDTLMMTDIGITQDGITWFTRSGAGYGSAPLQVTGFAESDDKGAPVGVGTIKKIYGKNVGQTGAAWAASNGHGQVDLVTLAGVDENKGCSIGEIYGEDIGGELFDSFGEGVRVGKIIGKNINTGLCKLVHGARYCDIGLVESLGNVGQSIVSFSGSTASVNDTHHNKVHSIRGQFGAYSHNSGTLVSADATSAVLAVGASAIDDYYFEAGASWRIRLLTGTGAPAEVAITDYTGSTRTITVASWPSGTPDNTTTYDILQFENRSALLIANPGTKNIRDNSFVIDGVFNNADNAMKYIVCNGISVASIDNNHVIINKDDGYAERAVQHTDTDRGNIKYTPGGAARAVTRLGLTNNQTIGTTNETTVNFDTIREDTYRRNGSGNLQSDTANLGIRQLLPGQKSFSIALRYSLSIADETVTVRLKRAGSTIFAKTHRLGAGTTGETIEWNGVLEHQESWFGTGTENLYTVTVEHSTGGNMTIANTGTTTWFTMADA